mmetsp:Transcript_52375/g.125090  ORF Transcript_52375/g.125090 Transcript_52375/m.125090 type:complete len:85 (-) Transcript_52375:465-719(-)
MAVKVYMLEKRGKEERGKCGPLSATTHGVLAHRLPSQAAAAETASATELSSMRHQPAPTFLPALQASPAFPPEGSQEHISVRFR